MLTRMVILRVLRLAAREDRLVVGCIDWKIEVKFGSCMALEVGRCLDEPSSYVELENQ